MLFASLRHALTHLTQFRGRDNPALFWPFAGLVVGASMALSMIGALVAMVQMAPRIIAFARAHPDQTHVDSGAGGFQVTINGGPGGPPIDPAMFKQFFDMAVAVNTISLIMIIVLLGAAITRRLHDSGMPGFVAWIPALLMVIGMAHMRDAVPMMSTTNVDPSAFLRVFAINLAYLASLGGLVYLLVRKGTPGDNRYGAPR